MKIDPAVKGFLISIIAFILAFTVYSFFLAKENSFLVDNPTSNTYYFKINEEEEKIITSGQSVKVGLNKGDNRIEVYNHQKKKLYDSVFQVNRVRGLLNIAHQDYYVNTQYYGYDLNKDSLVLVLGITNIDGDEYLGAPKLRKKLYIEDFYYNINEDYDNVVKNIQKTESRTKIFRKQDFLNYYKEYYHANEQ